MTELELAGGAAAEGSIAPNIPAEVLEPPALPSPRRASRLRLVRVAVPVVLSIGLVVATYALLSPGYLNGDAIWQLDQARTGRFSDWHPPLLSFVWRYVDRLIPVPAGALLLTLALFWTGLVAFLTHAVSPRWKAALGLLPFLAHVPLLVAFTQIGKDAAFIAGMVAGVGALAVAEKRRSWLAWSLAGIAFLFAYGSRHNGLFAIFPLALWGALILRQRYLRASIASRLAGRARLLALGLALMALVMAVHLAILKIVVRPSEAMMSQAVMVLDVAAISMGTRENYLPRYMDDPRPLTLRDLSRTYDPTDVTKMLWLPPGVRGPGFVKNEREFHQLYGAWVGAIASRPGAYLSHRIRLVIAMLGLGRKLPTTYWMRSWTSVRDEKTRNSAFRADLYRLSQEHRDALPFKAWPYLLACALLALFALVPGPRPPRVFWALVASIFAYQAAYLVVGTASDFRYSWWAVCGAPLLLPLLDYRSRLRWLAHRLRAR